MSVSHPTKEELRLMSEGVRLERKAMRAYLRRQIADTYFTLEQKIFGQVLSWLLARQKRYDKRIGGLGKK